MYNLNIQDNYLPSIERLNYLSKQLQGVITIFGYSRAAIKTLEISGVLPHIVKTSCSYLNHCNLISEFTSNIYDIVLHPAVVRVATPLYIAADSYLKYINTGNFHYTPLAWMTALSLASIFANTQETFEKSFQEELSDLSNNNNNNIDEAVAALKVANSRYIASIRSLTEVTAVVSYIGYNTYVNYKDSSKEYEGKKLKLAEAKESKVELTDSVKVKKNAAKTAEEDVVVLTARKDAALQEVTSALEKKATAEAIVRTTIETIEPTLTKVSEAKALRNDAQFVAETAAEEAVKAIGLKNAHETTSLLDLEPLEAAVAAHSSFVATPLNSAMQLYGRYDRVSSIVSTPGSPPLLTAPEGESLAPHRLTFLFDAETPRTVAPIKVKVESGANPPLFNSPGAAAAVSTSLISEPGAFHVTPSSGAGGAKGSLTTKHHPSGSELCDDSVAAALITAQRANIVTLSSRGGAATVALGAQEKQVEALTLLNDATSRVSGAHERHAEALRLHSEATTELNSKFALVLEKKELASHAESALNDAKLVEQQATTSLTSTKKLLEDTITHINELSLFINNFHPYAIWITGFALMELHFTRALTAWSKAVKDDQAVQNKFQMLMVNQPEGILNNYYDCSKVFGKNVSVKNSDLIPAILNRECTQIEKTEFLGHTTPLNQNSWYTTTTRIDDTDMTLCGEHYCELPLTTIEA